MTFILIYALLLILLLLSFLIFRNYKSELYKNLNKKEHPLKFIYGLAFFIMNLLPSHMLGSGKLKKDLEKLYAGQDVTVLEQVYTAKRFSYSFLFLFVFFFMGLTYAIHCEQKNTPLTSLSRSTSEDSYSLEVTLENRETHMVDITVPAQEFDFKASLELFESYREQIIETMLGDNPSIEEISQPLNFISQYGDEGLTISWDVENENLIDYSGCIHPENITEHGAATTVIAHLSIGEYETNLTIPLILVP